NRWQDLEVHEEVIKVRNKEDRLIRLRSSRHGRSEEHTSELQSRENLVCRLLLEKKNDDADIVHLFEPFYQGENHVRGTGIGLSLCKQITALHRRRITMQRKQRQGATTSRT